MTDVTQNGSENLDKLRIALDRLTAFRAAAGTADPAALPSGLTRQDLEVLINHVATTAGDYRIPDLPM